jgi:cytochrome c oxidase cbb3-type subunit 3
MKRVLFISISIISSVTVSGQSEMNGSELIRRSQGWESDPAFTLTFALLLVLCVAAIVLALGAGILKSMQRLEAQSALSRGQKPQARATWLDLFRKMPSTQDTLMEDHIYDNSIQEYDNAPPTWFNWLFYGSMAFSVLYLLYFHVFNLGDLQIAEYDKEMKAAEVIVAKAQEEGIKLAEQPPYTEAEKIADGKLIYEKNCTMCHGDQAQGLIGPNLTDEYWLHGGHYSDIFKTIFNGVPDKGMITWKKSLKPEEIREVASYVFSLKGTNPPSPKEPQGDKLQ